MRGARAKGLPVIYTTNYYRPAIWDAGSWRWKNKRRDEDRTARRAQSRSLRDRGADRAGPRDIVIHKQKPSGFFGTNMARYLTLLGCDSVVVTGTTTSGCVRATAVDAFSLNYRVALAEEGCFDRSQASHAISLCDMHAKYADVVKTARSCVLRACRTVCSTCPRALPVRRRTRCARRRTSNAYFARQASLTSS